MNRGQVVHLDAYGFVSRLREVWNASVVLILNEFRKITKLRVDVLLRD